MGGGRRARDVGGRHGGGQGKKEVMKDGSLSLAKPVEEGHKGRRRDA